MAFPNGMLFVNITGLLFRGLGAARWEGVPGETVWVEDSQSERSRPMAGDTVLMAEQEGGG